MGGCERRRGVGNVTAIAAAGACGPSRLLYLLCSTHVSSCAGGVRLVPSALDWRAPAQLAAWAAAAPVEVAALEQAQAQRPRGWGLGQHGMSSGESAEACFLSQLRCVGPCTRVCCNLQITTVVVGVARRSCRMAMQRSARPLLAAGPACCFAHPWGKNPAEGREEEGCCMCIGCVVLGQATCARCCLYRGEVFAVQCHLAPLSQSSPRAVTSGVSYRLDHAAFAAALVRLSAGCGPAGHRRCGPIREERACAAAHHPQLRQSGEEQSAGRCGA